MNRDSNSKSQGAPAATGQGAEEPAAEDADLRALSSALFDGERLHPNGDLMTADAGGRELLRQEHADFALLREGIRSWHKELLHDSATGRPFELDLWSRLEGDVERIAAEYRAGRAPAAGEVERLRDRFAALVRNVRRAVPSFGDLFLPKHNERSLGWGLAFGSACAAGLVLFFAQRSYETGSPGELLARTESVRPSGADGQPVDGGAMQLASLGGGASEQAHIAQSGMPLAGVPAIPFAVTDDEAQSFDLVAFAQQLDGSAVRRGVEMPRTIRDSRITDGGDWRASVPVRLIDPQLVAFQMSANDAMSLGNGVASGGSGGLRAGNVDIAWIRSANRFRLLTPRTAVVAEDDRFARAADSDRGDASIEEGTAAIGAVPSAAPGLVRPRVASAVDEGQLDGTAAARISASGASAAGGARMANGSPVIWVARRGRTLP